LKVELKEKQLAAMMVLLKAAVKAYSMGKKKVEK
jgi:hypothetical protein